MAYSLAVLMQGGDGWYDHMDGWGGGWMWLWGTLMMLSWVAIVAAALWIVQRARDNRPGPGGRAREILDERLARGEIDSVEHRERAEHLS